MRKFEQVFTALANTRSFLRGKEATKFAKKLIGDSHKNNRTITVNQTVRLFRELRDPNFANTIKVVAEVLEDEILSRRKRRTDAIDLSELVNTYRIVLMNGKSDTYRRRVSRTLSNKVG